MLNAAITKQVEEILSEKFDTFTKVIASHSIAGGSINETYRIDTNIRSFFIKVNSSLKFPGMFDAEIKGLHLLKNKSDFKIPEVVASHNGSDYSILILEYIKEGKKGDRFFLKFGEKLAEMHGNSADYFGLDYDNYIGSLKQINTRHQKWNDFFAAERLEPQLKMALDDRKLNPAVIRKFEKLYKKLAELLPEEKPSLIHGDLWSGNYIPTENNSPCIFDPAVYYGHREMDIAMSKLFGGFSEDFYNNYNDAFPMEKNWEQRMDIYNIYPLMVHVNLFSGSYVKQVEQIINKFI
jgi:protein-ribulosamine 3-kinase